MTGVIERTTRSAFGFIAGNPASTLATRVVGSMLTGQLRCTLAFACLGFALSCWASHALAGSDDAKNAVQTREAFATTSRPSQPPRTDLYGDLLPTGAVVRLGTVRFRQVPNIHHIAYSPDTRLVVTDTEDRQLHVWDANDGRKLRQIDVKLDPIRDFTFSPDGKQIAAVGHEQAESNRRQCELWLIDLATGQQVRRGRWEPTSVRRLAYAPDGKTIATISDTATLQLWAVESERLLHRVNLGNERYVEASIAFSPVATSHLLAAACRKVIYLWDVAQLRELRKIAIKVNQGLGGLAFSPDGQTVAAGIKSDRAEIRLWNATDGSMIRRFTSQQRALVCYVAFSPDGKILAASGLRGPLLLFDAATGRELGPFGREFDLVGDASTGDTPIAFSPDGRTLATIGQRQSLHFWDLATRKDRLATPGAHLGNVYSLAFTADGKTLFSGSDDRTVRAWDMATGQPKQTLYHNGWVQNLAVSADGSFLAALSTHPEQASLHLWNLKTGKRIHTWPVGNDIVRSIKLNGDGTAVTAVFVDGSSLCWGLAAGSERPTSQPTREMPIDRAMLRGLRAERGFVYAPDDQTKALLSEKLGERIALPDGSFRYDPAKFASTIVWQDTQTDHARREIEIVHERVRVLAFSRDCQYIAAGTVSTIYPPARGFIRIFRLRDKREIRTIESPCAWITALAFAPDGKQIVAGLQDTTILVWNLLAGE